MPGSRPAALEHSRLTEKENLMDISPNLTANRFQRIYEKVLLWAAILLLEFHMLYCPYRELVKDYTIFMRIERWFGLILAIAAIIYLILSAVHFRSMPRVRAFLCRFRSYEQYFLIFYFIWYIITVALRQHFMGHYHEPGFYFRDNDWWMYITGLIAFIMFPLARTIGNRKMEQLVPIMLKIILIPNIVFHTWVLWKYLHMQTVVFPSGTYLETFEGVSMAIGVNRNTTGAYGVTMFALCLYLVMTQKSWRKLPYVFGSAVYLAVLILSNCRTSWYACLITAAATGLLGGWFLLKGRKKNLRICVGLLFAVCCVLMLHWLRAELFLLLDHAKELATVTRPVNHITGGYHTPAVLSTHIAGTAVEPTPLTAVRTYDTGLSQREPLYRASIYTMFHSKYCFFLGVTPSDVGQTLLGVCNVIILEPHAHNFFLQMGMSYGVPTMLLTVAFTVLLAIRSVRILFRHGDHLSPGAWMIPVVVFCMLAQDMMEAFLNSGGTMVTVAFYLFAGWIVALEKELQETAAV